MGIAWAKYKCCQLFDADRAVAGQLDAAAVNEELFCHG